MTHRGNPSGITRSSYWPKRTGLRPDEEGNTAPDTPTEQHDNTTTENKLPKTTGASAEPEQTTHTPGNEEEQHSLEVLRDIWIKEDSTWDTEQVIGPYKKKLRPFSEDYKHRQTKLLGHIIRADNDDPMRKVTFKPNTIRNWNTPLRRVGRPKEQWIQSAKTQVWKKCRHREDRQASSKPDKRTKYKGKQLQDAYIHLWAEDRHF